MRRFPQSRGLSVLECIVTLSILMALLTTLMSIQVLQNARTSLAHNRLVAEQALANLADMAMAAEYHQLTADQASDWARQMEQEQSLAAGTLAIALEPQEAPAPGQRIVLSWQSPADPAPRYELVVWRFAPPPEPQEGDEP